MLFLSLRIRFINYEKTNLIDDYYEFEVLIYLIKHVFFGNQSYRIRRNVTITFDISNKQILPLFSYIDISTLQEFYQNLASMIIFPSKSENISEVIELNNDILTFLFYLSLSRWKCFLLNNLMNINYDNSSNMHVDVKHRIIIEKLRSVLDRIQSVSFKQFEVFPVWDTHKFYSILCK